ncbi:MAG: imidazole glycerol phosphate synthase subunit HisH [Bacteroidetes bacterium QH_9_64_21]|nr:MAG: imidazole glycerol phosphate synthase subunit HisH [Bacteroidetes bacterium QH_9_64_21]
MVTIIDYGIGNLRSIEKAFETVGTTVHRTDDPADIVSAERLVLPGVGAFRACIDEIRARGLEAPIHEAIEQHEGLGVLPGSVAHFREVDAEMPDDLSVPHMGWNAIDPTRDSLLLNDLGDAPYVYFVHSYRPVAETPADVLATTTYGHSFPSVVQRENVFGVQFHPEKSQAAGLGLLDNFAALSTAAQMREVAG